MKSDNEKDWSDILLMAWCGSLIFFALAYFVIGYIGSLTGMEWHVRNYTIYTLSMIQAFTFLVIPFAIKKASFKVPAFVMVIIYIGWAVYSNVSSIISLSQLSID